MMNKATENFCFFLLIITALLAFFAGVLLGSIIGL